MTVMTASYIYIGSTFKVIVIVRLDTELILIYYTIYYTVLYTLLSSLQSRYAIHTDTLCDYRISRQN